MRILVYGLNFFPELTGVGKYTGEMVQALVSAGHDVRVVTAPPYYPEWVVPLPHTSRRYYMGNELGCAVYRCPLWVPVNPGGGKRLVHLASFAVSSLPIALRQVFWKPDVVWTVEPSLLTAPIAAVVAKLSGAASWIHIQDFEIDAAFGLGLLRGATLQRIVLVMERMLLRRFDRVSTISNRMLERAAKKGVAPSKLTLFPNWVDTAAVRPLEGFSPYRRELGIPAESVVALYSGNMGEKQGLEILGDTARRLSGRSDIRFVFCGGGSGRSALERQCAGLSNVQFLPLQSMDRFNDLLGLADIHLLPQRADAADLVMPSKLTGMLASGRAVLATAVESTELAKAVSGRGVVVPPGDVERFSAALTELASDSVRRAELGRCARQYAEDALGREAVLGRFVEELATLAIDGRQRRRVTGP
ncbi:glycosyltransferase WbuB [Algiphilus sp. W345]|uniref:Glycosyltransferase WbuB n=1 Tax=Banduia mediterranea TaxID=3075609 RepID=A0ABU2WET3_9GAMM|nr:glycosyltransferase WbuB [Algiphilus sp. W345]MDT0496372.1 glycosyltransferase WbuB [Algiphilus sp. W345]